MVLRGDYLLQDTEQFNKYIEYWFPEFDCVEFTDNDRLVVLKVLEHCPKNLVIDQVCLL